MPLEPWRLPGAEVFEVVEEPWRRKVGDGEVVQVEGGEHLLLDPSSRLARLLSQVVSCCISYQQKSELVSKRKYHRSVMLCHQVFTRLFGPQV